MAATKATPSMLRGWREAFKIARAAPRMDPGSALVLKLGGELPDRVRPKQGPLSKSTTLPQVVENLEKVANDPRIPGVLLRVEALECGWAKLIELREAIQEVRNAGKFTIATIESGAEKEYYLASACEEIYAIGDGSQINLTGLTVQGTFFREALEKAGVEPQIKRIGEYKSAGDTILRRDMSDAQRQQLDDILNDIYAHFCEQIALARGKTEDQVQQLIDRGVTDVRVLEQEGFIDGVRYRDAVRDLLKPRTGGGASEVPQVTYEKYSRASPSSFGLRDAKKTVAIVHLTGQIVQGKAGRTSGSIIAAEDVVETTRNLASDDKVKAVVLRVDSPGGDALASEIAWRELSLLARKKPVIASMVDVAASGGYFISMAASHIIADPLTLTGSIGVVGGKFNLGNLYSRLGVNKVFLSRGRYAEVAVDNRSFTEEEAEYQERQISGLYRRFRDLAAECRGMAPEDMEEVARGRVWSGRRAKEVGLVDEVGGLNLALTRAKEAIGTSPEEDVQRAEYGQLTPTPSALLGSSRLLRDAVGALLGPTAEATGNAPNRDQAVPQEDVRIAGIPLSQFWSFLGPSITFSSGERDLL